MGSFVLGLEDEYLEVRRAAVGAMRDLSLLSTAFARKAMIVLIGTSLTNELTN